MGKKSTSFFDMQFITSSISTMLVLLLLGMVVFFVLSANNLSKYVRENISFSVLVSDDMKEADAIKFQKKLNADYANSDSIAWIEEKIMANKKVMEINYPQDLLDAVNSNIRRISFLLLGLAALLTLISFALINNTIRLTIYSKRFLIHTMKLVGASWGFIRKPFLVRNIWIGVLAAVMADAALIGMAYALVRYEPELIEIITPMTMLLVMSSVFVFGVIITFMCAYISINKYLRMKAGALYYI